MEYVKYSPETGGCHCPTSEPAPAPLGEVDPEARFGKQHFSHGVGRLADVVVRNARGSWVETTHGHKYLDFTSGNEGNGYNQTGALPFRNGAHEV